MATVKNEIAELRAPNNELAEQAVIGMLLNMPEMLDVVSPMMRPDDLYSEPHRTIYKTMLEMRDSGEHIDVLGVQDKLNRRGRLEAVGGSAYIAHLTVAAPTGTNIQKHVESICKSAKHRRIIKSTSDMLHTVAKADSDPESLVNAGVEEIYSLMRDSGLKEPVKMGKLLPAVIDGIEDRRNGVINAIKTGFDDIDHLLNGGMARSDLIIVAGRPSMGKTTFAMQIGTNAAMAGNKVAVFSLEMSERQLCERSVSQVGGIEYNHILKGMLTEDDFDRLSVALQKLHGLDLFIDDSGGLTVQDVAARARMLHRVHGGLDVIIIDYLQFMQYVGRASTRNDQISEMSRALKALAKELNVALVLLSQLNRDVDKRQDKRPLMSDLRESGAIEQDADVIMMVYRDEFYHADTEFKGVAEVIVRKARNGDIGVVGLQFEGEKVRFSNMSEKWRERD